MAKKKKDKTANEVKTETEAVVTEDTTDSKDNLKEEAEIAEALLKDEDEGSTSEEKSDETKAEIKETKAEEAEKQKKQDDEVVPDKKKYAEIMKTGSFVKAFVLMLIPGINIICVLLWAIGAAKNKNKVHFTRACIILFIIEIFLTAILLGAGYIAASVNEAEVLGWMDNKTNGLISYFEIDSYKDLPKLLETSKHLKTPEEENPTEPEVPKTCYVYNPDGIDSYDTFMELWNAKFHKETETTANTSTNDTTAVAEKKDLFKILEENNVDTKESGMIYIIIDNDKESCVIAFDPTGKLQSFPEIKINNENVFIGGTK